MKISGNHTGWNENKKWNFYYIILLFLSFVCLFIFYLLFCVYVYFLIGIPEDILNQEFLQTRALCKFSTEFLGCWTNRIVHTSVMVRFRIHYIGANGNRQCQVIFSWMTKLWKIPLASSPHHLAKCVICIFAKFVCFSRIRENTKTRKMTIFTYLQNSEK